MSYPREYLYKRIVQAKLFIDDHYAQKIAIADISDEAFFSKFHFIRLFKEIYGKTPHQYLTYVRISNATELLRRGSSIGEACHMVGFETLSAFSSLFKRQNGLTPTAFVTQQHKMTASPIDFIPGCVVFQHGLNKE